MVAIKVKWDDAADRNVLLPAYETTGAAGADLRANFPPDQRNGITLKPGDRRLVPTGLRLAIPDGFEVQIRPPVPGLAVRCELPGKFVLVGLSHR